MRIKVSFQCYPLSTVLGSFAKVIERGPLNSFPVSSLLSFTISVVPPQTLLLLLLYAIIRLFVVVPLYS